MLATWGCTTFPKPTLSLDFLGATSLDSGITFSRGSQATLFDSTGTLVYAKHNLALQSQDFATTWGVLRASISTDATTAPNGTVTADKLVEDTTASDSHLVRQIGLTITSATPYIFSAYLKAGERTKAFLQTTNTGFSNNAYVVFDLIAGTVFSNVGATSAAIIDVGNGWYRCSMGNTSTGTAGNLIVGLADAAGNPSYTGDGTSGLFLWGAQLNIANMEGGVTSSLTTYYPTTTAAYYAPRFDYNPSTLQPRGLLIEEQRTNLLLQSGWAGAVGGSPGTAPTSWTIGFGTNANTTLVNSIYGTAEQAIKFDADATERIWYNQVINVTNGVQYAMSVYIEAVSGSIGDSMLVSSGTATVTQNTFVINPSSPGRYTILFTATGTGTISVRFGIGTSTAVGGTCSVTMSRPQVEAGAFATSYIPTTTTALTRNADNASMTGTNFSSWFNASEGTIYASALPRSTAATLPRFYEFNGASTSISIRVLGSAGNIAFEVQDTTNQASLVTGTWSSTAFMRVAGAYKVNDFAGSQDGGAVLTDNSGTVPTVTALYIGNRSDGARSLNGWISRIAYYPTRLPNATLQALTL